MAVLGLHCFSGFISSHSKRGYCLIVVCGLLTVGASLVKSTDSTVFDFWASVLAASGLQSTGSVTVGLAALGHVGSSQTRD